MPSLGQEDGPRILIIDNYDSYTFNLFQYFTDFKGQCPVVIRNNQFQWYTRLTRTEFKTNVLPYFDAICISPGPGRPDIEDDFGICSKVLQEVDIPILGVCLGHQGLASVLGGSVVGAKPPMHGRLSAVYHDGKGLFLSIPSPFQAVRYHSLVVSPLDLPKELEVSAWSEGLENAEPTIMGLKHVSKPIWTVQFHPESICTAYGRQIITNFCNLVGEKQEARPEIPEYLLNITVIPKPLVSPDSPRTKQFVGLVEQLDLLIDSEAVFTQLYSHLPNSFWLDSARVENGLSRYSFMGGDLTGPESYLLQYCLHNRTITKQFLDRTETTTLGTSDLFFTFLAQIMHEAQLDSKPDVKGKDLPFFGGLVGYLGYEMKAETLHFHKDQHPFLTVGADGIPDSSFFFADRLLVFDHQENVVYAVALVNTKGDAGARKVQQAWIHKTMEKLVSIAQDANNTPSFEDEVAVKKIPLVTLAHEKQEYVSMIEKSLEQISQGETYEVCLTTQVQATLKKPHPHPFELYKHLRKRNPAPYASYLSFNNDLIITSSSPERFLRVESNRQVSMKPIKGTVKVANQKNFKGTLEEIAKENEKRAIELATSEKNRSENLMIVDLIRNDLNQISEKHTVDVPHLMVVESYATVHQLVSTVVASLRPDITPVDAVMRSFPPGSMTGAPKLRTVQIIEQLERIPRGVYSGVIGYFSVCGKADFSVVIRTAVFNLKDEHTKVSVGAGGAIVALSDPVEEYEEMVLKAQSVLPSLGKVYQSYFT